MMGLQAGKQDLRRKGRIEGFGPQISNHLFGVIRQPDTAEFARVIEYQAFSTGQIYEQAIMEGRFIVRALDRQIPAHPKVDEEVIPGKLELKELGPPSDMEDLLPGDS